MPLPEGPPNNRFLAAARLVRSRFRRHRPGGAKVRGDSDHPDRGWNGEFLDYPEGYDPWRVAIDAMCDRWSEWSFRDR